MHITDNMVQGLMTGQAMKLTENGASALGSAMAGSLLDSAVTVYNINDIFFILI